MSNPGHLLYDQYFLFQDDIIDEAQSFVAAAEVLKKRGAYKIYVIATHGLLSADAPKLLEDSEINEVRWAILFVQSARGSSGRGAEYRTIRHLKVLKRFRAKVR
jgi:phosphoribosylpyrophosphate synthetase